MKLPTFKHLQYARDDIMVLAKRLNELVQRVEKLESKTSASKSTKK